MLHFEVKWHNSRWGVIKCDRGQKRGQYERIRKKYSRVV